MPASSPEHAAAARATAFGIPAGCVALGPLQRAGDGRLTATIDVTNRFGAPIEVRVSIRATSTTHRLLSDDAAAHPPTIANGATARIPVTFTADGAGASGAAIPITIHVTVHGERGPAQLRQNYELRGSVEGAGRD